MRRVRPSFSPREPSDNIISYKIVTPDPRCGNPFGDYIFAVALNNLPISATGFHTGILRGGTVYDNIYPQGIPREAWENSVYYVPLACEFGKTITGTFREAVKAGIGVITVE